MINNNIEYILCAAIWYKELPLKETFQNNTLPVNCDKGIVFCGHRHVHCMYSMISVTGLKSVPNESGEHIQGFLTSLNRFVDRKEARLIAIKAGQVDNEDKGVNLYSEDLY